MWEPFVRDLFGIESLVAYNLSVSPQRIHATAIGDGFIFVHGSGSLFRDCYDLSAINRCLADVPELNDMFRDGYISNTGENITSVIIVYCGLYLTGDTEKAAMVGCVRTEEGYLRDVVGFVQRNQSGTENDGWIKLVDDGLESDLDNLHNHMGSALEAKWRC